MMKRHGIGDESRNLPGGASPWVGLVVVYFCFVSFGFVFQFLPPLLTGIMEALHLTHGQGGLLMSLFALPGVLLALPVGHVVDRRGVRLVGGVGLTALSAGTLAMGLEMGFAGLLAARLLAGVGGMISVVALQRTVTRLFEGRPLGLPMGIVNTAIPLGIVLALNVSGRLAGTFGWRGVCLLTGALATAACVVFVLHARRLPSTGAGSAGEPVREPAGRAAVEIRSAMRLVRVAGVVWVFANGAMTAFVTFAPDHYLDLGLGAGSRGFFASLPAWAAAIVAPAIGVALDRRGGHRNYIIFGTSLMATVFLLIPSGMLSPLVIGLALGTALCCLPTPMLALPAALLPPSHHGRAFGTLIVCANIGILAVPPLAGAVRDLTGGYDWPFRIMGLSACCGLAAAWFLPRIPRRR